MLNKVFTSPFTLAASAAHLTGKSSGRKDMWESLWENMGTNYPTPEMADVAFGLIRFDTTQPGHEHYPVSACDFYPRFNFDPTYQKLPLTFFPNTEVAPYIATVSFCAIRYFLATLDKFHTLSPKERTLEIQANLEAELRPLFENFGWPVTAIPILYSASALQVAKPESRHPNSPMWRTHFENLSLRFSEFQTLYASMK